MEVGLNAGPLEDEVLGQPAAERVELLAFARQRLNEVVRLLLHVHQAQVVEDEGHLVLDLKNRKHFRPLEISANKKQGQDCPRSEARFLKLPKIFYNVYVHLIDGAAWILPNSYAATRIKTHVSSVAPLFGDLNPD